MLCEHYHAKPVPDTLKIITTIMADYEDKK